MKQIINWTFGSFFRTIGRLLVFVILGIIISNFIDFGDLIDNFSITNLFFDKVDALTITSEVQKIGDTWWEPTNPNYEAEQSFFTWTVGKGENIQEFSIFSRTNGNPIQTSNADYIEFSMIIGIPQDITLTNQEQIDYDYCHRWNCTTFTANGSCQVFTCNQLYENTDTTTHYTAYQYTFDNTSMWIRVYYEGGGWNSCSIDNGQVTCPTNNKNIDRFTVQILFNPTRSSSIKLGIGKGINLYKKVNIQGAIENQTNVISDTNTTSDSNTATQFFNNTETDTGGLEAIVSAPLVIFDNLIDGTVSPLCFTIKGKQSCLPTGSIIWQKTQRTKFAINNQYWTPKPFTTSTDLNLSPFVSFFNLVVGGFLGYKMLLSMFRMLEDMLDPSNNKIEVMRL